MSSMKSLIVTISLALFFASCLKESIPEAIDNKKNGPKVPASFSFKVNGIARSYSVEDVRKERTYSYPIFSCRKEVNRYDIHGQVESSSAYFSVYTDSLSVGNYSYTIADAGTREIADTGYLPFFLLAPTDKINISISAHSNGYISGNFNAVLTPAIAGSSFPFTFGAPGSIVITEGSFKNVPVFY